MIEKTVIIVGSSSDLYWPTDDVDADVWSMNSLYVLMRQVDYPAPIHTWFQVHRPKDLSKESPVQLEWLRQNHPFPIYMHEHTDEYPSSVPLPVDAVHEICHSVASSFSWAVAVAILQGYKRIQMFGVHMAAPREIYMELPNLMFWCGIAQGRGISVEFLEGPLAQIYNYGFEPRGIPAWLPSNVAADIITDYNRTTRRWRKYYNNLVYQANAKRCSTSAVVSFEDAEDYETFDKFWESFDYA